MGLILGIARGQYIETTFQVFNFRYVLHAFY